MSESGEAAQYLQQVEADTAMLEKEGRVSSFQGVTSISLRGLQGKDIDARCVLQVVAKGSLPASPITVTQREIFINNEFKGYSYKIGVVPFHPLASQLDYTAGTFDKLTEAERKINPKAAPWEGTKTAGGTGCNAVSNLSLQRIIDIALEAII